MKTILGFGYGGKKLSSLVENATNLDAAVIDIRFKPWARNPDFQQSTLIQTLKDRYYAGGRFFGNRNYKGGSIEIVDMRGGVQLLESIRNDHIILMCMCWNFNECHRKNIASHLQMLGYDYYELNQYLSILEKLVVPESEQLSF